MKYFCALFIHLLDVEYTEPYLSLQIHSRGQHFCDPSLTPPMIQPPYLVLVAVRPFVIPCQGPAPHEALVTDPGPPGGSVDT